MLDDALQITATRAGDHDVLTVTGELDLVTAPTLHNAVDRVLEQPQDPMLVVDLSGVTFLDSAGLRVLVGAHRATLDLRGRLRIVCTTARVREVFRVANLDELFVVCDSVDEAVSSA